MKVHGTKDSFQCSARYTVRIRFIRRHFDHHARSRFLHNPCTTRSQKSLDLYQVNSISIDNIRSIKNDSIPKYFPAITMIRCYSEEDMTYTVKTFVGNALEICKDIQRIIQTFPEISDTESTVVTLS